MVSTKALEIADMIMGNNLAIREEVALDLRHLCETSSNIILDRDSINLIVQATLDILKHGMEYCMNPYDGDNYIDNEKRRLALKKLQKKKKKIKGTKSMKK